MPDTTVRRPTLHPPEAPDGAFTLVWTIPLHGDLLDGDLDALSGRLAAEFHTDVVDLLHRQAHDLQLRAFLARCRFSLDDLRARDDRAAVTAARHELMWQLRRRHIPPGRIGALLNRTAAEVLDGAQLHEADLQVARARGEWTAA